MRLPRTCAPLFLLALLWMALLPLSAASTPSFRVASYNLDNYLLHPIGTRKAKPPEAQALIQHQLLSIEADVLALQEIGGPLALKHLQSRLKQHGLDYPFSEIITGFDTNIQIAVLSRFPITRRHPHTNDTYLLLGRRLKVSRGFIEIDVQPNPDYTFTLFVAHLKSRRRVAFADEAAMREQEALLLRQHVEDHLSSGPNRNLILLGDFNDLQDTAPIRHLLGRGRARLVDTRPAERNGDTDPNPNPQYPPRRITWTHHFGKEDTFSRIDYILISQGMAREWQPEETYVPTLPNWGTASDHRPVVASFFAQNR